MKTLGKNNTGGSFGRTLEVKANEAFFKEKHKGGVSRFPSRNYSMKLKDKANAEEQESRQRY